MTRPLLRRSSGAFGLSAALLCTALFSSCSDSSPGACEGDSCDSVQNSSSSSDKGAGKDAGVKRDSSVTTGSDGGKNVSSSGPNVPCDVKALVQKYCGTCHGATPAFSAPMPLVTAADFQGTDSSGTTYASLVNTRLNATDPHLAMPPTTSDQPTAAEKATITAWVKGGAKGTSATCSDTPANTTPDDTDGWNGDAGTPDVPFVPTPDSDLTCYKLTAHADGDLTKPFPVGIATDAYFNFTFAAPWKTDAYAITISPVIGNMQAIHHWLLFEDDAPGIPGGAVHEVGAHPGGQLLMGWAPGGEALDFRDTGVDVGIELPASTTYTIEFHYNSSDAFATDASGVQVCVQTKKPANVAGLSWLGQDNLFVPSAQWTGVCRPISPNPIHILAVIPHMHLQGTHMKGTITRKDGSTEVLQDADFDFNYQKLYKKNVTINPGDSITTVCNFAKPMTFGESTTAEMCYLFTMAYPKGALASPDVWGSFAHGGSSCLGQ